MAPTSNATSRRIRLRWFMSLSETGSNRLSGLTAPTRNEMNRSYTSELTHASTICAPIHNSLSGYTEFISISQPQSDRVSAPQAGLPVTRTRLINNLDLVTVGAQAIQII